MSMQASAMKVPTPVATLETLPLLTFVCWKWKQLGCRTSYVAEYANIWNRMIRTNYHGPVRTICITDDPKGVNFETFPLWKDHNTISNPNGAHLPSCYRRLKLFNGETTDEMGIERCARVVSMDLDMVIVGDITSLFSRLGSEIPFAGWKRISPTKPRGYNGSLFMLRAGEVEHVWKTFDPVTSPRITRSVGQYGSDQGWISHLLAKDKMQGWTQASGVYSFSSDVQGRALPRNARIVSFNGKSKPWMPHIMRGNFWIGRNWR